MSTRVVSRRIVRVAAIASLVVIAAVSLAPVRAGGPPTTTLTSQLIVAGLTRPVFVTHAPGDFDRLFIVEKSGRVLVYKRSTGALNGAPFLDIVNLVGSASLEFGLLGMCFHPDYQTNGVFYVSYNDLGGHSVIAQCRVSANPDVADRPTVSTVLFFNQPSSNHRGGWLDFGMDGYLYASFGDGGGQMDPSNRAQNTALLQGKILRLDVDGADNIPYNGDDDALPGDANKNYAIPPTNPFAGMAGFAHEIWAYGLRNPWRCSFDRLTGALWIADVGQNAREEVDFQPPGIGGRNYGWRCTEGTFCTGLSGCTCNGPTLTPPIYEYGRSGPISGVSITGGYVYRGCSIPDFEGVYFFAEAWSGGKMMTLREVGGVATEVTLRTDELDPNPGVQNYPVSFGEDAFGEIYWVDYGSSAGGVGTGRIYKIVPTSFIGPDCNTNFQRDACDILAGSSADANGNGVPDECDCPADLDGDGAVGSSDLAILLGSWGMAGAPDLDMSGAVGSGDLAILLGSWGAC